MGEERIANELLVNIIANGPRRDPEAEFHEQLVCDSFFAAQRVLVCDAPYQLAKLQRIRGRFQRPWPGHLCWRTGRCERRDAQVR
jgi:hypothetical protein